MCVYLVCNMCGMLTCGFHTLWAPAVFMGPICCLPCVISGPHCGTQVKRVKLMIRYEVDLVNVLVMVGDLCMCVHEVLMFKLSHRASKY